MCLFSWWMQYLMALSSLGDGGASRGGAGIRGGGERNQQPIFLYSQPEEDGHVE